jgi:RimJ/RimL family protein N-acetyltransferase
MTQPMFTLRDARPDDAPAMIAYMRVLADEPDNGTSFSSAGEFTYTETSERQLVQGALENESQRILLAFAPDGALIGMAMALAGPRVMRRSADISLSVAKGWRRRGVATALMKRLIDWARDHDTVRRLELSVFENNVGAIALYERLGFQHEGRKRRAIVKHGVVLDLLFMGMVFDA